MCARSGPKKLISHEFWESLSSRESSATIYKNVKIATSLHLCLLQLQQVVSKSDFLTQKLENPLLYLKVEVNKALLRDFEVFLLSE